MSATIYDHTLAILFPHHPFRGQPASLTYWMNTEFRHPLDKFFSRKIALAPGLTGDGVSWGQGLEAYRGKSALHCLHQALTRIETGAVVLVHWYQQKLSIHHLAPLLQHARLSAQSSSQPPVAFVDPVSQFAIATPSVWQPSSAEALEPLLYGNPVRIEKALYALRAIFYDPGRYLDDLSIRVNESQPAELSVKTREISQNWKIEHISTTHEPSP